MVAGPFGGHGGSMSDEILGLPLHDRDVKPVGRITALFRYPADIDAPWGAAQVTRGRLLRTVRLVDLEDADIDPLTVRVPHSKATIVGAPAYLPLFGDTLTENHAADVRAHYRGTD